MATVHRQITQVTQRDNTGKTWHDCFEHYYAHRKSRARDKSRPMLFRG